MAFLTFSSGCEGLSGLLAWINPQRTILGICTSCTENPANIQQKASAENGNSGFVRIAPAGAAA
jgi:hypothetical protein